MRVRYKNTDIETFSVMFNRYSMSEVLTGDDSVFISDLDVFVNGNWKDMGQAFDDKDIIPDNYNEWFGEPNSKEDKERGYFL